MSCLYILDINPSLVISLANISSDSACCLSALSVISFAIQKLLEGFPGGSAGKESTCNVEDLGSVTGLERSPGEGKGYPLQYSGLENSMGFQRVRHIPLMHPVLSQRLVCMMF